MYISFPGITEKPLMRSRRIAFRQYYLLHCHFEDKDSLPALRGLLSTHDLIMNTYSASRPLSLDLGATNVIAVVAYSKCPELLLHADPSSTRRKHIIHMLPILQMLFSCHTRDYPGM